ncbi:hypothetical protein [Caloramator australicus]|uniref:Uncharacterized protein n=1 Tax=Caloramator australicus RC3 TaxID=857293 RepID=I7LIU7_9CLOT|nr:hypothetical protein [Caloramator australicus]CCJ33232.1 hypothetical protein CAAU_1148 [Caloramator australicus RC3]
MGMDYPFESKECKINESVESILNSEAEIAECLSCLFCNISDELKNVYPIEKRVLLTKQLVNAYACKEKAMADLIKSLSCFSIISNKKPCKRRVDLERILSVLIFLFILRRIFYCC